MAEDALIIRGAREHNLKNIDISIPRDRLTVITGLSGSGKSSLAFDTIYAEGQRRYVESLSAYARQFLGLMEKPDVDSIEGLSPAISIEQKSAGHNPRSTVGTVTEIYDYLRLLYARAGTPHCPNCGRAVQRQSAAQITDVLFTWPAEARIEVRAPLVQGRKGEFRELFESARKQGFIRAYVDGEMIELAAPPKLNRRQNHTVSVVVDRTAIRADDRARLTDSIETALKLADGLVEIHDPARKTTEIFSERYGCPNCGISLPDLEPRQFSFNSPFGACPQCGGLGTRRRVAEALLLGDPRISILEGVVLPWGEPSGQLRRVILPALARQYRFDLNSPWGELPADVQQVILHGDAGVKGGRKAGVSWEGVLANVERRYDETGSDAVRLELQEYMLEVPCEACHGYRLKPESLAVTIDDRHIGEIADLPIAAARDFMGGLRLRTKGRPGL
ncbi:MAG: excinuclease ABC subunit UvrA, partial [Gemmatimonadaceae bacterium]